jgi:RNA polymerase sigma-54 factor
MYTSSSQTIRPKQAGQATAHLAQTMTLLGMSGEELRHQIQEEIDRNPALELVEDRRCPSCGRPVTSGRYCPLCSLSSRESNGEPVVFVSGQFDSIPRGDRYPTEDEFPLEEVTPSHTDIVSHVMRQISIELEPEDRPIAIHILSSLDENGLLDVSPFEVARYHHIPTSKVEAIVRQIQFADPVGVGSPSAKDALLVQLEALQETQEVPPLATKAVRDGMALMGRRQYQELGRLLDVSAAEARRIAQFISENLNPFPAQAHWGGGRYGIDPQPSPYHKPDIVISFLNGDDGGPLTVEILMPIAGSLRVDPDFRKALKDAPDDRVETWRGHWEKATLLIKCLDQRNHTMVRLLKHLVVAQREFILKGNRFIHPITRASMAELLEVHESTISRAVSNKSVQLPSGRIVPLDVFFDRSLHIRTIIKEYVETETQPYSDSEIAELLTRDGFQVARRTVAKYRAMENILAAHLRRKQRLN